MVTAIQVDPIDIASVKGLHDFNNFIVKINQTYSEDKHDGYCNSSIQVDPRGIASAKSPLKDSLCRNFTKLYCENKSEE